MPRTCIICRHPKRTEIDAALVEHRPFRDIARQFGPSKDALLRRHDNHPPVSLTQEKDAAEIAHADTTLAQAETSVAGFYVPGGGDVTEVAVTHMNGRQELFAQEYAVTGNGTQSAITAGYSAKTAYAIASRLLKNVKVAARIKEIQAKAAERAEVTIESIRQQLDQDRLLAHASKQAGAAVSATMAKAKLYGLLTDKIDAKFHLAPPVDETAEERARKDVEEMFGAPTNGAKKPQRIN